MPSETLFDRPILLVAPDAAAWEVLQTAAVILENFELKWQRAQGDTPEALEMFSARVAAAIVASPDEALPSRWSAETGLVTLRVPVPGSGRSGLTLLRGLDEDGLPAGPPEGVFATMAIGEAGAKNAALFVVAALATTDAALHRKLAAFRREQTDKVLAEPAPAISN